MKYNRLLSRAWRAGQFAIQPAGIDEQRSSGRSTALVLFAMSEAINNPGEWITIKDHPEGQQGQFGMDRIVNEAMSFAARLELRFFEKRTGRFGLKCEMVSQIRCDLFTDNPWSIA